MMMRRDDGMSEMLLDTERVRAALAACEGVPTELLTPGVLRRTLMLAMLPPAPVMRDAIAADRAAPIIPPGVGGIDLGADDLDDFIAACATCRGQGHLDGGVQCPDCGGSGVIDPEDTPLCDQRGVDLGVPDVEGLE